MTRPGPNQPCPCGQGSKYKRCCRPFHRGQAAPTPVALMRSRYAAYAAGEVEYILATTDPDGPQFRADRPAWVADVQSFCDTTEFLGLDVLAASQDGDRGVVTFRARLSQGGRDASFAERSTFVRSDGRWLYSEGAPPQAN